MLTYADSYAWGRGEYGCLGLGDVVDRLTPSRIEALSREVVMKLLVYEALSC